MRHVLEMQNLELEALCRLRNGYKSGDFEHFADYLTDESVFESQWVLTPLIGKESIMDYLRGKGTTLKAHNAFPETTFVEISGKDIGLLLQQAGNIGVLVVSELDDNGMVKRIDLCHEAFYQYRKIDSWMTLTPVKELYDEETDLSSFEEHEERAIAITTLYYDELGLFFEMTYSDFDPMRDYHMLTDDWIDIVKAWRAYYEAEDHEMMCEKLLQERADSFKKYPRFEEWFRAALIKVWEKKTPYGLKMLKRLEAWLDDIMHENDWVFMI